MCAWVWPFLEPRVCVWEEPGYWSEALLYLLGRMGQQWGFMVSPRLRRPALLFYIFFTIIIILLATVYPMHDWFLEWGLGSISICTKRGSLNVQINILIYFLVPVYIDSSLLTYLNLIEEKMIFFYFFFVAFLFCKPRLFVTVIESCWKSRYAKISTL